MTSQDESDHYADPNSAANNAAADDNSPSAAPSRTSSPSQQCNDDSSYNSSVTPSRAPSPSQQPNTVERLERSVEYNYMTRWIEDAKFFTAPIKIAWNAISNAKTDPYNNDLVDATLQETTLFSNGFGLISGLLIHWYCVRYNLYKKNEGLNPLYRNFKTLANVALSIATAITSFFPFPTGLNKFLGAIITDSLIIGIGILALPYWLLRKSNGVNPAENKKITHSITGTEGWSKYGKTALVFGNSLGQALGVGLAKLLQTDLLQTITIAGAITAVTFFLTSVVLVPFINRCTAKKDEQGYTDMALKLSEDQKDTFRNNYIRSGLTLGLAIGSAIGFILGMFVLPGIGSTIGMAAGGAFGSIIFGTALGISGQQITLYTDREWKIRSNSENSWDYATRTTSYAFAFVGSIIGFFLPIPGGMLLGAAVFGAIGWGLGLPIIKKARELAPKEPKADSLSWSQRVATGANLFSMIGAIIGCIVGLAGGPGGVVACALIGGAIGGAIGSAVGAAYDPKARDTFKKLFQSTEKQTNKSVVSAPTPVPSLRRASVISNTDLHRAFPPSKGSNFITTASNIDPNNMPNSSHLDYTATMFSQKPPPFTAPQSHSAPSDQHAAACTV